MNEKMKLTSILEITADMLDVMRISKKVFGDELMDKTSRSLRLAKILIEQDLNPNNPSGKSFDDMMKDLGSKH